MCYILIFSEGNVTCIGVHRFVIEEQLYETHSLMSSGAWAGGEWGEVATPIMHLENVSPELQQNILYSVAVFEKPR